MLRGLFAVILCAIGAAHADDGLVSVPGHKIMIFGGEDHRTYLGCLSCSSFATDSVLNMFGPHGSPYQTDSIFNHFSQFGSSFSSYGACNTFATDPPVVVDEAGNYYGRLTLNAYKDQVKAERLIAWLEGVCQQ